MKTLKKNSEPVIGSDVKIGRCNWRLALPVVIILIAAAALRFYGLHWGLPNSLHSYSYHPDEFLIVGSVAIVLQSLVPSFYNYPSLFIYLAALAVLIGSGYGIVGDPASVYLCARVVGAVIGVAAVAATYRAGKAMWGSRAGIVAAIILCIAPLHVQHSHFATVDVPSTFFVAVALGFAGWVAKRGTMRDYVLCGVMIGFAAGTKYNTGIIVTSLLVAHLLRERSKLEKGGVQKLIAALGCSIIAFLVSTPGAILRSSEFLNGLTYEMKHSAAGHGLVFAGTGNGLIYTFTSSLWYGLGPGLAVLFIGAIAYGLWRRDRNALIVLAFVLPYYALISLSHVRFARYALPLFPAAAVLIGWMVQDSWSRLIKLRWTIIAACAIVFISTLFYSLALDRLFVLPDPRNKSARFIAADIPKGSSIGVEEVPWFYSPPYSKMTGFGTLQQRREAMVDSPYKLIVFSDSEVPGDWRRSGQMPDWVVLSDYEIADAARLRESKSISVEDECQVKRICDDVEFVRRRYKLEWMRENKLEVLGYQIGRVESLPHDMRYPAPAIWVYHLPK